MIAVEMQLHLQDTCLERTIAILSERIEDLLERHASEPDRRVLVALAGVPGSGKSTISAALVHSLVRNGHDSVVVVPMDGFHYSKQQLATFSCPETAIRRRGAPFTFDSEGFVDAVALLKKLPVTKSDEPALAVRFPGFDHAVQDPVEGAIHVPSSSRVVIVEGNYILLDEEPWLYAAAMCDEKWFVDVAAEKAKERIIKRHILSGIEKTKQAAASRVEENDVHNGHLIRAKLIEPDLVIQN